MLSRHHHSDVSFIPVYFSSGDIRRSRCCWSLSITQRGARARRAASLLCILRRNAENMRKILYYKDYCSFSWLIIFQSLYYLLSCALWWLKHPSCVRWFAPALQVARHRLLLSHADRIWCLFHCIAWWDCRVWRHSLSPSPLPCSGDEGRRRARVPHIALWNMTERGARDARNIDNGSVCSPVFDTICAASESPVEFPDPRCISAPTRVGYQSFFDALMDCHLWNHPEDFITELHSLIYGD